MIKNLNAMGKYIEVTGGQTMYTHFSPGGQGAGMLRWNTNTNNLEVNDGVSWRTIEASPAFVGLTSDARDAIDWALAKKQQEEKLERLCQEHQGIRDLKEKLEIMIKLVQDHAGST